jgi:hypothetical protein
MNDCLRFRSSMHALSEGEAPASGEGALLGHAAACAACARALDSSRRLVRALALASHSDVAPPPDLVPRILAALPGRKPASRRRTAWALGGGVALALVLGGGVGAAWLLSHGADGAQLVWLRASMLSASAFIARFAALLAAAQLAPALPAGPRLHGSLPVDLQGLALIVTGLLGAASALCLAATAARQTSRHHGR